MKARIWLCGVAVVVIAAGCSGAGTPLPKTGVPAVSGASGASPSSGAAATVAPSAAATSAALPSMTPGTFMEIGAVAGCYPDPVAALAGDGKLIVTGCGEYHNTWQFDPATGKASEIDANTEVSVRAVTLRDGRVFVLFEQDGGALVVDSKAGKAGAEIDSPGSEDSPAIGYNDATLLLNDGRVLIAGGDSGSQNLVGYAYANLFDPATGKISRTGSMTIVRSDFTAVKLADGRVLVAGGETGSDLNSVTSKAEIFDPATGKFTATGSLRKARYSAGGTLLPGGKVLIVGGTDADENSLSSAELFDPRTGKFSLTGSMAKARGNHEDWAPLAVPLPDGRVVVMGGEDDDLNFVSTVEIYDPATGKFKSDGAIGGSVYYLTGAFLQADGTLLVVGGGETGAPTVWRYQP